MINKDQVSKIGKKRQKRVFSPSDKQRLYGLWKTSGLTRSKFCKEQDLVLSAFSKWCRTLSAEENTLPPQNNWLQVIKKDNPKEIGREPVIIELKISNSTKIVIVLLFVILCLKEFFYAINSVW